MKNATLFAALFIMTACGTSVKPSMTEGEARLINESSDVMRILSVDNTDDLVVLRDASADFNMADIGTSEYRALAARLVSTLESTDGGVGLAAPQVGINRRVVAVQRVDKEGEPIEVYPNIRIVECRGDKEEGPEGCLSVPDIRGNVMRYRDITIEYTDVTGGRKGQPRTIREDVAGFAAVIFQHEVDHLEGVIFTDKAFQFD